MRPGLSGWMHENAEVLELLTFWRPEQQAAYPSTIRRPPLDQTSGTYGRFLKECIELTDKICYNTTDYLCKSRDRGM